jgi:hypothetical protein
MGRGGSGFAVDSGTLLVILGAFNFQLPQLPKEQNMADHPPLSDRGSDPFRFFASPVGPRILQQANKIFEDFPFSRYVLYFAIFAVEVIAVFWLAVHLIRS